MNPTNEEIVKTLEENFPNMGVYYQRMTDPEQKDFNYFLYMETGLRKADSCKWTQVISIRAILDPIIPVNFELDVVEKMAAINLRLSNSSEIEYSMGRKGNTDDTTVNIVEFTFLRPFSRVG